MCRHPLPLIPSRQVIGCKARHAVVPADPQRAVRFYEERGYWVDGNSHCRWITDGKHRVGRKYHIVTGTRAGAGHRGRKSLRRGETRHMAMSFR